MKCAIIPKVKNSNNEWKDSSLYSSLLEKYNRPTARSIYTTIHTTQFREWFGKDWTKSNEHPNLTSEGEPKLIDGTFVNDLGDAIDIPTMSNTPVTNTVARAIEYGNTLSEIFSKHGVKTSIGLDDSIEERAKVQKGNITLNPKKLREDSLPHEFSHIYVDMLGHSHPLVQRGIAQAIKLYPELKAQIDSAYADTSYTKKDLDIELLVTVMGKEAANVKTESDFAYWMNRFFRFVGEIFGVDSNIARSLFNDIHNAKLRSKKAVLPSTGTRFQKEGLSSIIASHDNVLINIDETLLKTKEVIKDLGYTHEEVYNFSGNKDFSKYEEVYEKAAKTKLGTKLLDGIKDGTIDVSKIKIVTNSGVSPAFLSDLLGVPVDNIISLRNKEVRKQYGLDSITSTIPIEDTIAYQNDISDKSKIKIAEDIAGSSILIDNRKRVITKAKSSDISATHSDAIDTVEAKDTEEATEGTNEALLDIIENERTALRARLKHFQEIKSEDIDNQEAITNISKLLAKLELLDAKEQFAELVVNGVEDTNKIVKWLGNDKIFETHSDKTARYLVFIKKYAETYSRLDKQKFAEGDTDLRDSIIELNVNLSNITQALPSRTLDFFTTLVHEGTAFGASKEEIRATLEQSEDIEKWERHFGDVVGSKSKLLAIVAKEWKKEKRRVYERNDRNKKVLSDLGNTLRAAGVTGYDWMINKDTATFVGRTGKAYNIRKADLESLVKNEDGEFLKYIEGLDVATASKEDLKFNIELADKKKTVRDFLQAERWDSKKGEMVDGENHSYTSEFKKERSKHERFDSDSFEWVKKATVTNREYTAYKGKYYKDVISYLSPTRDYDPKTKISTPTGEVTRKEGYFVKDNYIESHSKWNDERYTEIQSNKAKADFYNAAMEIYEYQLSKLPSDVAKGQKGRLPAIAKHFIDRVSQSESKLSLIGGAIRNSVVPAAVIKHRATDENGVIREGIPIFYTNDLKSQEKLETLKAQKILARINELNNRLEISKDVKSKATITENIRKQEALFDALAPSETSIDAYKERLKELDPASQKKEYSRIKNLIKKEENNLNPEDINTDVVDALISFGEMAENYEIMTRFSYVASLGADLIADTKFIKRDASGNVIANQTLEGHKSLTLQRYKDWLDMVVFDSVEDNDSAMAQTAQKWMSYVSLKNLGLNWVSGVNNLIIGGINQNIEAWGEQFFDRKEYRKATADLFNYMRVGMFSETQKGDEYYDSGKYKHKVSAAIAGWQVLQDTRETHERVDSKGFLKKMYDLNWAYKFNDIGEYANQSRIAIAVMRTEKIQDSNGKEISVWDAHELRDGKFELREGIDFSFDERSNLITKIKEINKLIHGRYAQEDKMAIQRHWLGQMAAHFKKWVAPAVESRFRKGWQHEGIGIEMEGRYRTLATFMKYAIKEQEGLGAWHSLSDVQRANMIKNAVELGYFVGSIALMFVASALAEEVDDDDPLLNKAANLLVYQSSRQVDEISTFFSPLQAYKTIKEPFAATGTIGEAARFISSLAMFPFGNDESNYRQRGLRKDEAKFISEGEKLFFPTRILNKWEDLSEQRDYFIR
jgi:hypothetical protein